MRVLYYAPEFYCHHGARTHARQFFQALSHHPDISETLIFPTEQRNTLSDKVQPTRGQRTIWRSPIEDLSNVAKATHRHLPASLRQQVALLWPSFATYNALSDIIKKERPTAAVLRLSGRFRYLQRLRSDFPSLKLCVEYNSTIFDEEYRGLPAKHLWRHEEARQLAFADSIGVVSGYLRRYLLSLRPALASRIFVNPNGVDVDVFRPADTMTRVHKRAEMGIPADALVLGYVGGMETFRRLPKVVSQVAALRSNGLDRLFLVLIGAGADLENVRRIADENQDDGNWIYCPGSWVDHEAIPSFMAAFDVGIFPYSNPYGSPQKLFEYMACALPVIGPKVPAVTEHLDHEIIPFLVQQDGSNFDELVRYVYHNVETCRGIGRRSRVVVEQEYSWSINASRVVESLSERSI